jgi:hypothetical protein
VAMFVEVAEAASFAVVVGTGPLGCTVRSVDWVRGTVEAAGLQKSGGSLARECTREQTPGVQVRAVRSGTVAGSSGNRIAGSFAWPTGSGSCCERVGAGGSTEPVEVASC